MTQLVIGATELAALKTKIMERLALDTLSNHPWTKLSSEELDAHLWLNIENAISLTLKGWPSASDYVHEIGFVFGSPLNDTVFMLTGVEAAAGNIATGQIRSDLLPGKQYSLDFYVKLG